MNFEINKFYKTKGGRKVRIICIDGPGVYPIAGYITEPDDESLQCWTIEGNFSRDSIIGNLLDLSEEWTEPKKKIKKWLWVDSSGILSSEFFGESIPPLFGWIKLLWSETEFEE